MENFSPASETNPLKIKLWIAYMYIIIYKYRWRGIQPGVQFSPRAENPSPVCTFSPFVFGFWFLVFVNSDGGFSDLFIQSCPMHFAAFLVLPRKLHPAIASSRVKIIIQPRDHLYSILPFLLEKWMISLVC